MTITERTTTEAIATETKLLTADDLLRLHREGVRGELIRGVLEETMVPGFRHGKIIMNLGIELGNFVKPRQMGTLVAADAGVWLERDPDTVRGPDIAFTSVEKIPLDADIPGYVEIVPDLVVEVRSPSDSRREAHDKAHMWLNHGVQLVWVIHPDDRTVDVHRRGRTVATLVGEASLDGADVLPGFTCPLTMIFDG